MKVTIKFNIKTKIKMTYETLKRKVQDRGRYKTELAGGVGHQGPVWRQSIIEWLKDDKAACKPKAWPYMNKAKIKISGFQDMANLDLETKQHSWVEWMILYVMSKYYMSTMVIIIWSWVTEIVNLLWLFGYLTTML